MEDNSLLIRVLPTAQFSQMKSAQSACQSTNQINKPTSGYISAQIGRTIEATDCRIRKPSWGKIVQTSPELQSAACKAQPARKPPGEQCCPQRRSGSGVGGSRGQEGEGRGRDGPWDTDGYGQGRGRVSGCEATGSGGAARRPTAGAGRGRWGRSPPRRRPAPGPRSGCPGP